MMKPTGKIILIAAATMIFSALLLLLFVPTQKVSANHIVSQELKDCLVCHDQAAKLWENSRHNQGNITCLVCHKLADSTGEHPDFAKYTVESEETTCLVCHAEVTGNNVAGQLALSQHGKVGLTCISCHEQHSQGLKLAEGSRTVCENCHKYQTKIMLESTHFAAGLSCVNCHMGEERNHTLVVAVATCDKCHQNLHNARRMLDAGLDVKVMDTPVAMVEITPNPTSTPDPTVSTANRGVTLPSWTYALGGTLLGGLISWALFGKEPGKPSNGE